MKKLMPIENQLLALSNDIAEYPPMNLSMHEWQALIVLSSVVNSKERPILGIDDIQEIARERGLTTKREQNQLLNELIAKQNRYELTYDEFFSHYKGDTPMTRKTKHDILKAMESISGKTVVTANTEKMYASFSWFDHIINDKENKKIRYSLGQVSKALLMGLERNFLQMMARLSIKEAKKYDIPIFVHMKSKLHNKKDAFSWTEPLPQFQQRFGHDQIASYSAWKDYHRRILSSAEAYSLKSDDIGYKFEGKATKGRKITHIYCKVWRIGNIHTSKYKMGGQEKALADKRRAGWEETKKQLTEYQYQGFEFLKSKSINHSFLLEECLLHSCMKHQVVKGYEDVFFRYLWQRFSTYTKAQQKGGAFVTWWRRGKLTEGDHYWATIDTLSTFKKNLSSDEFDQRAIMATMNRAEWKATLKADPSKSVISKKKVNISRVGEKQSKGDFQGVGEFITTATQGMKNPKAQKKEKQPFNYITFKNQYPKEHQKISTDLFRQMDALYGSKKEGGVDMDMGKVRKIEKQVQNMLPSRCDEWYKKNILKGN